MSYDLSILIPTLGRPALLSRVLDRLDMQTAAPQTFEVIVVADAKEREIDALDEAAAGRSYRVRRLQGPRPGASAARNMAWRSATAPVVLFLDDDILPESTLVAEHIEWHRLNPQEEVGVLGHVRWADELRVTPFMRWLEHGIQFNYPSIQGNEAGWGHFYTANASVKRSLVERVNGFEETALPFGYEDLDLALRMHEHGFRLLYNRSAVAEHVHPMDIEFWKRRVSRIALSEREFVRMHPEIPPYFFEKFSSAAAASPAKGRGVHILRFASPTTPILGRRAWTSADSYFRQVLAKPFLAAWHAEGEEGSEPLPPGVSA